MMVNGTAWVVRLSACRVRIATQTWRKRENPVWSRQQKKDYVSEQRVWLHECVCSWLSLLEKMCLSWWRARRGRTANCFPSPCGVATLGMAGVAQGLFRTKINKNKNKNNKNPQTWRLILPSLPPVTTAYSTSELGRRNGDGALWIKGTDKGNSLCNYCIILFEVSFKVSKGRDHRKVIHYHQKIFSWTIRGTFPYDSLI